MASQGTFLLCRLCLVKREFLIDIFQIANRLYTVAEVIIELLQLHVRENDGYSKFVCLRCCDKLFGFKEFKGLCLQAKETFEKKFLPLLNSEAENERRGTNQMVESPNCSSSSDNTDNAEETELPSVEEINTIFVPSVVPVKEDPGEDRADNWTSLLNNEGIDHVTGLTSREENNRLSAPSEERDRCRGEYKNVETASSNLSEGMEDGRRIDHSIPSVGVAGGTERSVLRDTARQNSQDQSAVVNSTVALNSGLNSEASQQGFSELHQLNPCNFEARDHSELKCDRCGLGHRTKHELSAHVTSGGCARAGGKRDDRREASNEGSPSCTRRKKQRQVRCGETFIEERTLSEHSRLHTGLRPFKCDACGREFKRKTQLKNHLFQHTGLWPLTCELCGRGFTNRGELNRHSTRHSGLKPYKCEVCGKGFNLKSVLKCHLSVHVKPFKCGTCGKHFKRDRDLKIHSSVHVTLKQFKCEICGKDFKHRYKLNSHLVTHSDSKPYKCETCGENFKYRSSLRLHLATHSDSKPYKCETCGKVLKYKKTFKVHLATHSDSKPYKCETCGKVLKYKNSFKAHLATHSDSKPYKCEICGKDLKYKTNLKSHLATHSDSKPFKCGTCGKDIKYKRNLKLHLATHSIRSHLNAGHAGKIINIGSPSKITWPRIQA